MFCLNSVSAFAFATAIVFVTKRVQLLSVVLFTLRDDKHQRKQLQMQ